MYHLTLEMLIFRTPLKPKISTKFSLGGCHLWGEQCESTINFKMFMPSKVKSDYHVTLSSFALAIWCHLLTNKNKPYHSRAVTNLCSTNRCPPSTSDCTVKPTRTHESSNHWLIHKFLNKQVLGPWRKFKISNFKNTSIGFLHFLLFLVVVFFLMWTILKVFIEFMTILLLFYVLFFWPQGMWDLSSSTGDQTALPALKG